MNTENIARPQLTLLSPTQIDQVYRAALDILWSVGLRVDAPWARQLFVQAGAKGVGDRIRIQPELIEWARTQTPSRIDLYGRRGAPAFTLGGAPTRFGVGVTALHYQDPLSGDVTPFGREHLARVVRLGQALPAFDVISTPGILHDRPPALADLYAALDMAANAVKPLVLLVSEERRFGDVLDLLEHLGGDLGRHPFALAYVNPVTPLVLNAGTADKMKQAIERGVPLIFSNYGMAGATTPIVPGGALALLHAELLVGLALAQVIRPGAPVVLGSLPAQFAMRAMQPTYGTTSYLLNLACAELIAHLGLPHCGTSGSGMGWDADLLAAGHQWINHLTACIGKVGLAPFVGSTLGDLAFSPALLVYADEVIALARRFAGGLGLEIDLDEIAGVGPAGDFIGTESTLRGYRKALESSEIWPRLSPDGWQAEGRPQAIEKLRARTQTLLETSRPPADHDELTARGEAFIRRLSQFGQD
ncbi:MAG: trimethylamine methyltransferase family protein [Anaerolineae bacterium]|nr:trimethylamine methyltransferase family protein [Anaerolineae bacterium]